MLRYEWCRLPESNWRLTGYKNHGNIGILGGERKTLLLSKSVEFRENLIFFGFPRV